MRRTYLFWGVFLVILSCLFILKAIGILSGNLLDYSWQIFLIVLGFWVIYNSIWKPKSDSNHSFSINLNSASQAKINIHHGAGRIKIKSGTKNNELLSCTSNSQINHEEKLIGNTLTVSLNPESNIGPVIGLTEGLNWDLIINKEIPLSLILETGASQTVADLSDLNVIELKISTGASTTSVILPSKSKKSQVTISAGAATLDICVPITVGARIQVKNGLTALNIDNKRFLRSEDNFYQSQSYDTAVNQTEINIDSGLGSVTIR
jgi:hypothetical protein